MAHDLDGRRHSVCGAVPDLALRAEVLCVVHLADPACVQCGAAGGEIAVVLYSVAVRVQFLAVP